MDENTRIALVATTALGSLTCIVEAASLQTTGQPGALPTAAAAAALATTAAGLVGKDALINAARDLFGNTQDR